MAAPVRLAQIQNLCGLEARLISREDYTNDGPRKRVSGRIQACWLGGSNGACKCQTGGGRSACG